MSQADHSSWMLSARASASWTVDAISNAVARMDEINPIDDLEEMEKLRKTLRCLKSALPHMEEIRKLLEQ